MEEYRTRTPILKTILTTSHRPFHTACITTVKNITLTTNAKFIRLESAIRNPSNVAAKKADGNSRIRNAVFAKESANLSQQSIIQHAAASMLMQATPVLSLA